MPCLHFADPADPAGVPDHVALSALPLVVALSALPCVARRSHRFRSPAGHARGRSPGVADPGNRKSMVSSPRRSSDGDSSSCPGDNGRDLAQRRRNRPLSTSTV
jgi:hypothetical protein